ncbi:hypothetical protein B0T21DRAFT_377258 [Apiosordaria backusii]|uniref:Uncharacterized protein n=1 Tax=Apiosordaria backusii TaxID=314023 RepID=A0AA40A167_9PEZI|nr:hypothetical protein B0T21DRAFT_377258 [Apiosordaria backusii]
MRDTKHQYVHKYIDWSDCHFADLDWSDPPLAAIDWSDSHFAHIDWLDCHFAHFDWSVNVTGAITSRREVNQNTWSDKRGLARVKSSWRHHPANSQHWERTSRTYLLSSQKSQFFFHGKALVPNSLCRSHNFLRRSASVL